MTRFIYVFITLFLAASVSLAQNLTTETAADHVRRGIEFLRAQKYEDAHAQFQAAAKLEPKSAGVRGNIGIALQGLKRTAEAVEAFREAARLDPTDGTFHTAACRSLLTLKKYDEAVKACEEGTRLSPKSADAHAVLLEAMDLADRPDAELSKLVNAALTRFNESEEVLVVAAEYHLWRRNRQIAVELWEQLTRLRPTSAYYLGRFAEACVDVDRDADAISAARRSLEIERDNPYGNYAMGRLFLELGQHGDASAAFTLALRRKDRLPYAQYYLGVSEGRAGRTLSAIAALKIAVQDNPKDFASNFELADQLISNSQFEDAVEPMRRALSIRPNDLQTKVSLGLALFESAQFPEAIRLLEEADRAKPGNETIMMFLRVSRTRMEHMPRIDEMKRTAAENPKDVAIRTSLIQLLAYARRIGEADLYLREFLALKPREPKLFQKIAVAYSTAGQTEKALEIYRKSAELGEDPGNYLGFAALYAKQGKADEASAAYAKVIELKPDAAQTMFLYANHLRDNGRRREALEMYRRSLSMLPTLTPSLSSAAILSAKLGETDAARTYISTLKSVDPEVAAQVEAMLALLRYLNY